MGRKTRDELEAENERLGNVVDAVADILDDEELSAAGKVSASLEELDTLEDEEEEEEEEE